MAQNKDIYVYMDWQESDLPIQMGVLHSEILRGKEVFSFESTPDWLTYKQFRARRYSRSFSILNPLKNPQQPTCDCGFLLSDVDKYSQTTPNAVNETSGL